MWFGIIHSYQYTYLCTQFDIRVFNSMAQTNWQEVLNMYTQHEQQKNREYNARTLEIEKGMFTLHVFSCSGRASVEATKFIKQLARKLSNKCQERYSSVVSFLRRSLRFDILRTCVILFRGECSLQHQWEERRIADLEYRLQWLNYVE